MKKACVLDSWLGDDSASSFSFVGSGLVEWIFFIPVSDNLLEFEEKYVGVWRQVCY